jgi:hypothetical protein
MKINPHIKLPEKPCLDTIRTESDLAFAQELSRLAKGKNVVAAVNDGQAEFVNGLSSNFDERLAHYENTASTPEHSAYVEMMKYFKENNKS